ncbi:hypothetical protein [Rhizobium freirei]|uniref:hypothetical protein n=1 Tax=Rhizobium freirei TaxID=1353277 RepID=UPI0012FC8111|nr:hypothetical protein [Rhizobium freirei]
MSKSEIFWNFIHARRRSPNYASLNHFEILRAGIERCCIYRGSHAKPLSHKDCRFVAFWSLFTRSNLLRCKKSSLSGKKIEVGWSLPSKADARISSGG